MLGQRGPSQATARQGVPRFYLIQYMHAHARTIRIDQNVDFSAAYRSGFSSVSLQAVKNWPRGPDPKKYKYNTNTITHVTGAAGGVV